MSGLFSLSAHLCRLTPHFEKGDGSHPLPVPPSVNRTVQAFLAGLAAAGQRNVLGAVMSWDILARSCILVLRRPRRLRRHPGRAARERVKTNGAVACTLACATAWDRGQTKNAFGVCAYARLRLCALRVARQGREAGHAGEGRGRRGPAARGDALQGPAAVDAARPPGRQRGSMNGATTGPGHPHLAHRATCS